MPVFSSRPLILATLGFVVLGAPGCTRLRSHQGYVVDPDLVNAMQPGVDTRQSVQATLGTPTVVSQFNGGDWFYVARDTRSLAHTLPKPTAQTTLRVHFDDKGVMQSIARTGLEQAVSLTRWKKTTPTLGRKHNLFRDLFGNIGTVGAGGIGTPGGNGSNTGTGDQ